MHRARNRIRGLLVVCLVLVFSLTFSGCLSLSSFSRNKTKAVVPRVEIVEEQSMNPYDVGKGLYEKRKYSEAVEYFDMFLDEYPESSLAKVALYYKGHSYQQLKDHKRALQVYQQVLDKFEDDFWADLAAKRIVDINEILNK